MSTVARHGKRGAGWCVICGCLSFLHYSSCSCEDKPNDLYAVHVRNRPGGPWSSWLAWFWNCPTNWTPWSVPCCFQHTLQFTFDLWNAMSKLIQELDVPLPAGKHLLQEVVATWNRGKGPIDVNSCFQENVKSCHCHLGPVEAIWLRLIMTSV